jgi:hypothetical protein
MMRRDRVLGSARLQRAGFGILPKQSLSSRRQNVVASTLQACAPQISNQRAFAPIGFNLASLGVKLQGHNL